jgi:hypothetical protein
MRSLKEEMGVDGSLVDKILKQLKRIDLTFDRLTLYGVEENEKPAKHYLLNLKEVVERVLNDIPDKDREQVVVEYVEPLPFLNGELYQLYFCFQTNLSYLLRFLPESRKIYWKTWNEDKYLISELNVYFPMTASKKSEDIENSYHISKTLFEMATGKSLVKRFLDQHNGQLLDPKIEGDSMALRIQLPIA